MKILLFGSKGQLGWELQRTLSPLGEVKAVSSSQVDLNNAGTARAVVQAFRPHLIVNAAAYTAVDRAEREPERAHAINVRAVREMAEEAHACGAAFIHYSTDYVFDGRADRPYREEDEPNPLSFYGKSKLDGEREALAAADAVLVLRTAWVYSLRGETFVRKMLQWAVKPGPLRIVDDQVSNPTWARMLAEITALLVARAGNHPVEWIKERRGLYHLAGEGYTSRMVWAQEILKNMPEESGLRGKVVLPAKTADYPAPAERPLFSALDTTRYEGTFDLRLPDWRTALAMAMQDGPLGG